MQQIGGDLLDQSKKAPWKLDVDLRRRVGSGNLGPHLGLPGFGNRPAFLKIVDDKTKLVRMIAVHNLDIHARIGQSPGDLAQLAGNILPQLLHKHFANVGNLDTGVFESIASGLAVIEQKMHMPDTIHNPTAAALDTDTRRSKRLAHPGHLAGPVF